jgi:hypothetical protein
MTLVETLEKMIILERESHCGSKTDLALGRESILREIEIILKEYKNDESDNLILEIK